MLAFAAAGAPNAVRRPSLLPVIALLLVPLVVTACGSTSHATTTTTTSSTSSEPRIEDGSFHSKAVEGTLHYAVALPPGYDTTAKRYPVVYFLHGLPANDQAYKTIGGYADSLARSGLAVIVVGAQGAREATPTRSGTTGARGATGRRPPNRSSYRGSMTTTARSRCARPARSSASLRADTGRR